MADHQGEVQQLVAALEDNLTTRGVVRRVGAYIHAEVQKALLASKEYAARPKLGPNEHLLNAMIAEYLAKAGHHATLSVFEHETGAAGLSVTSSTLTGDEPAHALGRHASKVIARQSVSDAVAVEARELNQAISELSLIPSGLGQGAADPLPPVLPVPGLPSGAAVGGGRTTALNAPTGHVVSKRGDGKGHGFLSLAIVKDELGLEDDEDEVYQDDDGADEGHGAETGGHSHLDGGAGQEAGTTGGRDTARPQGHARPPRRPVLMELVARAKAGRYVERMSELQAGGGPMAAGTGTGKGTAGTATGVPGRPNSPTRLYTYSYGSGVHRQGGAGRSGAGMATVTASAAHDRGSGSWSRAGAHGMEEIPGVTGPPARTAPLPTLPRPLPAVYQQPGKTQYRSDGLIITADGTVADTATVGNNTAVSSGTIGHVTRRQGGILHRSGVAYAPDPISLNVD